MPNFRYEALDATGQSRLGEIEADDVVRAAELLAKQSLVVLSIEMLMAADSFATAADISSNQATAERDYEARIDQVLEQPQPLISLLEALAEEPASADLRKQLDYLLKQLRQGVNARQFLHDDRLCIWLPLVMSGEGSPVMEARYSQWLTQVFEEKTRRRSLLATFSYPLMLMAFAMLITIPICVFIVPSFQKMFAEFGLSLPAPTRFLFMIGNLINYYPHYLILGLLVMAALTFALMKSWVSQPLTTRWFGWVVAGNSVNLVAMSRLTSVLAELIELGAPVVEALPLAGRASRHAYYRDASLRLAGQLADPDSSWQASPVAHNFPLTLLHALSAGEGNRASAPLIRELSHLYSDRVAARLSQRSGISSPLLVLAVGMVVGLVVVALFMPLVQMVSSLS